MGTFSSVRGARPLALILLALLLHGDAASAHRGLQDAEAIELPWNYWANSTEDAKATELLLYGASWPSWANETDPATAAMAKHMAAVGVTNGYARWWLSWMCPRREKNGSLPRMTRRCYTRGLRSLEKRALLWLRPPPQESPEEEARRRVVEILTTNTLQVFPWPDTIRNPVIKTKYRRYRVPSRSGEQLGKPRCRS